MIISACISVADNALSATDIKKMKEEAKTGNFISGITARLLGRFRQTAMSLSIWRLLMNGISIFAIMFYHENNSTSLLVSILSLLILLTIQILIPRLINNLVILNSTKLAKLFSPILWILVTCARPLASMLRKLENQYIYKGKFESTSEDEQSISTLITIDEQVNPPDEQELSMIRGILTMEESIVREVMVPRLDLIAIDCEESIEQAVRIMNESGHSRILVYENSIDNIIGTLHARDLLLLFNTKEHKIIMRHLVRPVIYAPESKKLDDLLRDFRHEKIHMAVVVDEYGATAGLVTLNDVIEEIIGVVSDEFEKAESDIEIISDNEIIVNAGMHVEILLEQFSVEVETDGFDTIGGLLYSKLGKMANPNDEVIYKNLKLTILSTAGRRIKRVKVTKKS
jgi:CBS domain containing-hemolysin-like protein